MRRKDREIRDFNKMLEILKGCDCCRIGLVDDFGAYIVPMNFGYEVIGNELILYFHSANEGKKIDLIKKQGIASFEMDCKHELVAGNIGCNYSFLFQSIMGRGEIEIVRKENEKVHGLKKIMKRYTDKEDWDFEAIESVTVLKLAVRGWSCKENQ